MTVRVDVSDLSKRYGRVEAVRGIGFQVGGGEIFGLLGPNGAGKTTTLECLTGLRVPDRGRVVVAGCDIRTHAPQAREKLGVVLQTTALPDQLEVREALEMFGAFHAAAVPAVDLLERFALGAVAGARYGTLSGGQRQRVALALAFVNRPEVVVLDEPTAGLDPQARHELHEEIRRIKRAGCAVLLSTHQLEEARQLCDRLAILDHGRIVATGTPDELAARGGGRQTVTLTLDRPMDAAALASLPGVEALACEGGTARFQTADATRLLPLLHAWIAAQQAEVRELHIGRATLEEVFLRLTQAEEQGREQP